MATASAPGAAAPQLAQESQEVRDLGDVICKAECYCLNENPNYTWRNLFMGDDRLMLQSDADEQLLLHIGFNETVRLHSIDFRAPSNDTAPLTVKLFTNKVSMGFSDAEDTTPTQVLELTPEDLAEGSVTLLKFVKFQRVSSLSIFVEDNNGAETSCLSAIKFLGSTVASFNMNEFKKQGEEG
ncbi:unnamed protein product [Chrysoparadoxa australica]